MVAQVSRSARQAQLRRLLRGCEILPFTPQDAHPVGELLAKANTSDVVDAHLALTASQTGAVVLTGDFEDLTHLASFLQPKPEVRAILS